MTWHDDGGSQSQDAVEGGDPVLHRSRPHDRVATDEEDVAGEDHACRGQVHDHVARGMGGPDLEEAHLGATHVQRERAFERLRGLGHRDAVELERSEDAGHELAEPPHVRGLSDHGGQHVGRERSHLLGA